MKAKNSIKLNRIFDIIIFALILVLCCDADNGKLFYFLLAILAVCVLFKRKFEKKIIKSDMNKWNYLFLAFSVLSVIWSINAQESLNMIIVLVRRLILIFAISVYVRNNKDVEKIMVYYLIANFCMMLKISLYIFINGNTGHKMWDVICGNYFNTVAQFLAIGIVMAYYFIYRYKDKKILRIFCMIFIVFSFYHIYITGSRKGLIMPLIEIVLFRLIDSGVNIRKILKNGIILILISIVVVILLSKNQILSDRFSVIVNMFLKGETEDESTTLRQSYIILAQQMFFKNPLLGQGINTFGHKLQETTGVYRYCHNNFWEILSGTGIIGFILYYWYYIKMGINLLKNRKKDMLNILGFSILFVLTIFEIGIVTYSIYIYPIILAIFSVVCRCEKEEKIEKGI